MRSKSSKRLLAVILSLVLAMASLALVACGKTLEGISVTAQPAKTRYMAGESFDPTGMVVTAKYSNETTEEITQYTYDLTAPLKETDTKVVVSYGGKTAEVAIKVSNPITGIAIKTHATKVAYKSGESFDPAGMVITVSYYDDSSKDVAIEDLDVTYSKEPLKVGMTEIEIKYEGMTTKEAITVTRGTLIESAVDNEFASKKAYKKSYVYGSVGFDCHEEVFLNNGTTGPATGYKGFDQEGRWVTYSFELKTAGKVDLVWNVAGSDWLPGNINEGVANLADYFNITIDELVVDVDGIELPAGDGDVIPVWWNTKSLVIKDVELAAGKHVFKAVCLGGAGVNVDSMTVYSDAEIVEEKSVSVASAELLEKSGKPYLVIGGTYSAYAESDFKLDLKKLSDSSTAALTTVIDFKDGGLFEIEVDLSGVAAGNGDMIFVLTVGENKLDLEFAGEKDGTIGHVTLGDKSYTARFEAAKTNGKTVFILTVESAYGASVDASFTSSKTNSILLNYYSAGTLTTGKLTTDEGAPTGGIGNLGGEGTYLTYKFVISEKGLVDLVLRAAGSTWNSSAATKNDGVADLGKAATLSIDGTSIGVNGIALPSGDKVNTMVWWNLQSVVLKNLELEKGEHTFKIAFLGNGGVNIGDLTVYSEKTLSNVAEYKSTLVKGSLNAETEGDKSTKTNKIELVYGSKGFDCHEDIYINNGTTGPATGYKGFDNPGRWASYTFALEKAAAVDFVWQIAGSAWNGGTQGNDGIEDLFRTMNITIDGVPVDVRGYELPAGTNNDDQEKLVWWYVYDIVVADIQLSAGIHTFRAECLTNSGVNVSFFKAYSNEKLTQMSGTKAEKTEVGSFTSDKQYTKQFVWGSEGVATEGAFSNTGATGPKDTGIKGLDSEGRWLTYTFTLSEAGEVDFVWQVAGSKWVSVSYNPGIDDMGNRVIVTIDGTAIDVSGIALPGGNGEDAPAYWKLYDLVIKNVSLSAGEHVFRIYATGYDGGINIASMTVASSVAFGA